MTKNIQKSGFSISGLILISLIRVCSWLPLRLAHALGSGIGLLVYWIPNNTREITRINIERCFPDLDKQQQNHLVKQSLKEAGKTLTELGAMWYWSPARMQRHIHIDNDQLWQQVIAPLQDRGTVVLCPHLGCWEIVNHALALNVHMTSLYRPHRIEMLNKHILRARVRTGSHTVPTSNSGVKALYSALRKHQYIGILPDQDPGAGNGLFTPFFGIQTNTMPLAGRLIKQSKARAYLIYGQRLARGKGFKIIVDPAPDQILIAEQERIATIINEMIEKHVRVVPAQYQWTYKRFKYQPDGSHFYARLNKSAGHKQT